MKLNGDAAFQYPWGFFANNGNVEKRSASPDEINSILASLSTSHSTASGNQDNDKANNFQLANTQSMSELINDANTILAQATAQNDQSGNTPEQPPSCEETNTCPDPDPPSCRETGNCPPPPPAEAGTPGGYAAGVFDRKGARQETGLLQDVLFNPGSNSVSFGISDGEAVFLRFDPISASVTRNGVPLDVNQDHSQTQLTQREDPICTGCDFLSWGRWETHLNYRENSLENNLENNNATTNLFAGGWWVAGELTTVGDIDTLAKLGANATYSGTVHGTVINLGETYDASGSLNMNWSFADRRGGLTISNFDERSYSTGPNGLSQPTLDVNQFRGSLKQTSGPTIGLTSGSATGSFVNNGSVAAGGVMGKWHVEGDSYKATGVFGGKGTPR